MRIEKTILNQNQSRSGPPHAQRPPMQGPAVVTGMCCHPYVEFGTLFSPELIRAPRIQMDQIVEDFSIFDQTSDL